MISFLNGKLVESLPTQVVIEVHGVGYQALIPLSSYDRLPPPGEPIHLLTELVVREDSHTLYGFATPEERDLFRLLVGHVSGIGPKMALAVLSGMSVEAFKAAIIASDVQTISRMKGVGRKTAERIIVDLKDKVGIAAEWEAASERNAPDARQTHMHDAVLALISLGYKQVEAHKAVKRATESAGPDTTSEELVRLALKNLA